MNKLSNYFLTLFMCAFVVFVTSCGDDSEDILPFGNSTITGFQVDGSDTLGVTADPGETVILSVGFDLDEDADVSLIGFIGDSIVDTATPLTSSSINPLQTSFDVPDDATEDFVVTYELQDADGNRVDSDDFEVTLNVDVAATEYSAVLLAAPLGEDPGERTSSTFFSASDGDTYSVEQVITGADITSDKIHFGYYFGATNRASIASPAEYPQSVYDLTSSGANWGTLNETSFRSIDASRFEQATSNSEVAAEFDVVGTGADEGQELNELEEGDTFAFRYTQGEETKFGMFQVDAITPGIESTGSITLTVKVETAE